METLTSAVVWLRNGLLVATRAINRETRQETTREEIARGKLLAMAEYLLNEVSSTGKKPLQICFFEEDGEVLAVFPQLWDGPGLTCYRHLGQHGHASKEYVDSLKFMEEGYEDLFHELSLIYDDSILCPVEPWMAEWSTNAF